MSGQTRNAFPEHADEIEIERLLVAARTALALEAGNVPDMIAGWDADSFTVREILDAVADRPFRHEDYAPERVRL